MNLYFQAAQVLDTLELKQTSLKSALSALHLPEKDSKRLLALVISTLKYKPAIAAILKLVPWSKDDKKAIWPKGKSGNLALVLVHDLVFADRPGIQSSSGPIKDAIQRNKTRIGAELIKYKIKKRVTSNKELQIGGGVGDQIPRYARINTNLTTSEDLIAFLQTAAGGSFTFLPGPGPYPAPLPPRNFHLDEHIPHLLVFPLSSSPILTAPHPSYAAGHLILQDKASCFPAYVLDPSSVGGAEAIDATAAPGNKTSHLSMLLGNAGKVHAFELSPKRFELLQKMIAKAGCKNVEFGTDPRGRDFLATNPKGAEWSKVQYILLDPSCSGSGIVNRLDFLTEEAEEENDNSKKERLDKLAGFQLSMIRHAMKFSSAHRIVYSTCSIHPEEDEMVVLAALESAEAKEFGWQIAPQSVVLPSWERRGREDAVKKRPEIADAVVCCEPGTDKTNGFFVSCFIRPSIVPAGHTVGASSSTAAAPPPTPAPAKTATTKTSSAKSGKKRKSAPDAAAPDEPAPPAAPAVPAATNTYSQATQGLDDKRKKKKRKGSAAKKAAVAAGAGAGNP